MYLPATFAETDLVELDALVAAHPFTTLVTMRDGAPYVSHLPVLYARDGGRVVFRGHWSRANPQWRGAGDALLIVHGPDTYVSPSWYPDNFAGSEIGQPQAGPKGESQGRDEHKAKQARVPTWNYAVAHIGGTLETLDDTDALASIVSELSVRHETAIGSDWRFEPDRADHVVQLKGIVGFRMQATRIELKFKLSQNHPLANQRRVVAALTAQSDANAQAIARLMQARLQRATVPDDNPTDHPAPER